MGGQGQQEKRGNFVDIRFKVTPDEWIEVEELLTMFHPDNSQVANEEEDLAIQASIRDQGFVAEMLVLNPWNRKLVSGHQRTRNCHALGFRGKLPVVYLNMESEEEHRLAMLRFNMARGHQDPELLVAEINYLIENSKTPEELGIALARTEAEIHDLLALAAPPPSLAALEEEHGQHNTSDFWPVIKLQVHPETYDLYQSLMTDAPGNEENEKFLAILRCVHLSAVNWEEEDGDG